MHYNQNVMSEHDSALPVGAVQTRTAPIERAERITNLDTIRGFATLGILLMNGVSFGLISAAYWNLDAGGSSNWFDWTVGVGGEIFVDQKMMGLFSLLFGVGIVVFADRAAVKGKHPVRLSLWRNLLLLGIGVLHALIWEGDVLIVYAICSPVLLAMRKRSPRTLFVTASVMMTSSVVLAFLAQSTVDAAGLDLGDYWLATGGEMSGAVLAYLIGDAFLRALAMMLIGVALYRLDIVQGQRDARSYVRLVKIGLSIGVPIAAAGAVWQLASDFSPDVALASATLNTVATVPIVLAYLGIITLFNQRQDGIVHERIRAVGRMALTNYLVQTIIGVVVLTTWIGKGELGRGEILLFVMSVWVLQIVWSKPWLDRFRFGPFEWAWRCLTYRQIQPIRR